MLRSLSQEQKSIIAIQGDFLGSNLTPLEKETILDAIDNAEGDVDRALAAVDASLADKVQSLLNMGIRFSLELEKLKQRGITVLPVDDLEAPLVLEAFKYRPRILFCAGNLELLYGSNSVPFFSSKDFKVTQCNGILIADKTIDSLLRDEQIVASILETRGLVISDSAKRKASVNKPQIKTTTEKKPSGKSVFISGSRTQREIAAGPQESLGAIISQGIAVLLGDSDKGVDKEIADFLRAPLYENVRLYTVEQDGPRIPPEPAWRVITVQADPSLNGQKRQMVKDRAMADAADFGMAIFHPLEKNRYGALQVSSGTLRNVIQMLLLGKPVKFFYDYEGKMLFRNIKTLDALESILLSYKQEQLSPAEQATILSGRGVSPDDNPASVKCKKIIAKYRSLLKSEKGLLVNGEAIEVAEDAVQAKLPGFE